MKGMKRYRVASPAIFCVLILFAVTATELAANVRAGEVDFNIRFFDRRIYYVGTDPIFIQITVTNNSPFTYRFRLADDRVFSIDFDVRTANNRPLQQTASLVRRRTQSQQIFFREVSLETGESFSFVEDLREFVRLDEPGSFVVSARLFPELHRSHNRVGPDAITPVLQSGRLALNIRPPVTPGPDGLPLAMEIATGAVLARERLPPDQVVEYMITARQRSQWERFFLYLDLEAMLANDPVRRREWNAQSAEGRRRMTDRFREELRASEIDGTISVIPTVFEIERTEHNGFEGTVTVLKRFAGINFTSIRRYIYFLRQRDGIWLITDYSVTNLGTE